MLPLILLTNDDGVHAPGLLFLADSLRRFAEVVVIAPHVEQSAKSHAITLHDSLRCVEHQKGVYSVTGTPVDTVYIGLFHVLSKPPSLVVSGINHGPNLGKDVHYSGTVAAAREGALRGIPSIALSTLSKDPARDAPTGARIVERFLASPIPDGQAPLLNVNFPAQPPIGIRACALGDRKYHDAVDVRHDPRGGEYLWIGGPNAPTHGTKPGTDARLSDEGFITVTPLSLDATLNSQMPIATSVTDVSLT